MSEGPLVSIVLPTHNRVRYLDQAIQSVQAQTHSHWELIVVDDASTDQTPDLVDAYARKDARIHLVRHAVNRKLPAALNTGFAEARGRYLTWTSDDNAYRPAALAEMVAFLENHAEVGLVYAGFTRIDEAGAATGATTVLPPEEVVSANVIGACFLYRRAVQETIGGYDEQVFCAEDLDYWLRASMHFRLAPLQMDLYLYRHHSQSLSATRQERVLQAAETVLARSLPAMRWLGGARRAMGYLRLTAMARRRNDSRCARRYMLRALRNSPGLILGCYKEPLIAALLGASCAIALRTPYLAGKGLWLGWISR